MIMAEEVHAEICCGHNWERSGASRKSDKPFDRVGARHEKGCPAFGAIAIISVISIIFCISL